MHCACSSRSIASVTALLEAQADVSIYAQVYSQPGRYRDWSVEAAERSVGSLYDCQPLLFPILSGESALVQLLIEKGADVNAAFKWLPDARPNIHTTDCVWDECSGTPLMIAASMGYEELCGELLDRGARIDETSDNGTSALINAAGKDQIDACRTLLVRGADVEILTKDGWTALTAACLAG